VIFIGESRDHMTSLLIDCLHWLPMVRERVTFTLCLLVYKALHWLWTKLPRWHACFTFERQILSFSVQSSVCRDNDVTRTRLQVGKWTSVAGPTVWNNLSTRVQTSETLTVFKSLLYVTFTELLLLLHIRATFSKLLRKILGRFFILAESLIISGKA